jgi:hypothetical protein
VSPSMEAASCASTQEFPAWYGTQKVHCHVNKSPPLVPDPYQSWSKILYWTGLMWPIRNVYLLTNILSFCTNVLINSCGHWIFEMIDVLINFYSPPYWIPKMLSTLFGKSYSLRIQCKNCCSVHSPKQRTELNIMLRNRFHETSDWERPSKL